MGKGKRDFTQDIADILADDLALLDALDPGAVKKPDAPPPEQAEPQPEGEAPGEEAEGIVAESELVSEAPATVAPDPMPVVEPAATDEPVEAPLPPPIEEVIEVAPPPPAEPADLFESLPVDVEEMTAAPAELPHATPTANAAAASAPVGYTPSRFADAVTVLEIAPPEAGGVRESAMPVDRSQSPPPPRPARRIGWNNRFLAWTAYVLLTVALALFFFYALVLPLHIS